MRNVALALVALVVAVAASAQSAPAENRHPWEWTLDERLNDRLDPAKIRERNAAAAPHKAHAASTAPVDDEAADIAKGRPLTYDIDGRSNPELYLPHELFDMLLFGLAQDASHRAKQQQYYRKSIRELGYDNEMFWSSLASVSGDYREMKYGADCTDKACSDTRCAARYDALEAARQLFGREEFNRILYTVVAATMQSSTSTLDVNHQAALRREEMGCR